jgi:hypothetical protein
MATHDLATARHIADPGRVLLSAEDDAGGRVLLRTPILDTPDVRPAFRRAEGPPPGPALLAGLLLVPGWERCSTSAAPIG